MFHNQNHSLVTYLTTPSEVLSLSLNKDLPGSPQAISQQKEEKTAHTQPRSKVAHSESSAKFPAGTEIW